MVVSLVWCGVDGKLYGEVVRLFVFSSNALYNNACLDCNWNFLYFMI